MKNSSLITTILIAVGSISTGSSAQNVYRCGSSYSQKPCPDAVVVDVGDSRSQTQKVQADAKTRRETTQVLTIEKARQKEEAQQRTTQAKLAAAEHKKSASKNKKATSLSEAADGSTAKARSTKSASKTQPMKKEPEFFVARTPADKVKPAPRPN